MIPKRDVLLGSTGEDITSFAGRVGAFLLSDLINCVGDTPQLAASICRALKSGLLSVEFDEKLVVVTEAGLRAAGLSDLEPCRVRRYNVLDLIEGARFIMSLEQLGYPVYGPREQHAMRRAGHELPSPVLRQSADMTFTCSPGQLLWVNGNARPVALQLALRQDLPPRWPRFAMALHHCDELAGVMYCLPEQMVHRLESLLAGSGINDRALVSLDYRAAVEAVMSGKRLVIVPEHVQVADRRLEVSRLLDAVPKHEATTISYHAAVEAINHALPEVDVLLAPGEARELIKRVLAVPLRGRQSPSRDSDARIGFRETVSELANELRWQRAGTCGASYEHTAEWILELPLQESIEDRPLGCG